MIVIATDAPLSPRSLERLAKRSLLAFGRVGAFAANGSGDYSIAFSTHPGVRRAAAPRSGVRQIPDLSNQRLSPLFLACVEATEEAIYNSLFMATDTTGFRGRKCEARIARSVTHEPGRCGRAKFMPVGPRRGPPLTTSEQRAKFMDTIMAPRWFKTVTRDTWDDNNFYPHDYARHPVRALQLWRQAYQPTLPVWVRYLCEGQSRDISLELKNLKVHTLILKPGFDKDFYSQEGLDYMRAFCHDSWKGVEDLSDMITIQTIEDSRVFIMDDQPEKLDQAIDAFLTKRNASSTGK